MITEPTITGTRYVLAVHDLKKSVAYYKNILGLQSIWSDEGWHTLQRDRFIVMLGECPDDRTAFETNNHSYFAYIEMQNIDALYKELQQKNAEIISEIASKRWGQREFAIRTIDGHRIMFGEEID